MNLYIVVFRATPTIVFRDEFLRDFTNRNKNK